jgi:ATP synthase protein I
MPDRPDEELPSSAQPHELSEEVGAREMRKVRARRTRDRTLWLGLEMFGVIGWSVAVPTLIGIALGIWFDRIWPGRFSWTLALLLAGVMLGCVSAWYWVSREREAIEEEDKEAKR